MALGLTWRKLKFGPKRETHPVNTLSAQKTPIKARRLGVPALDLSAKRYGAKIGAKKSVLGFA
jgi:carbamoylphosphate synthase small subunit